MTPIRRPHQRSRTIRRPLMTNIITSLGRIIRPVGRIRVLCRPLASQATRSISCPAHPAIRHDRSGRIVVPAVPGKLCVILTDERPCEGEQIDRAFGIIVPNQPPLDIDAPWRNFRGRSMRLSIDRLRFPHASRKYAGAIERRPDIHENDQICFCVLCLASSAFAQKEFPCTGAGRI